MKGFEKPVNAFRLHSALWKESHIVLVHQVKSAFFRFVLDLVLSGFLRHPEAIALGEINNIYFLLDNIES